MTGLLPGVSPLTVRSSIKQTPLPPFGKASGGAGACEEGLTVAPTILYHSKRPVGHYHPFPLASPHQFLSTCLVGSNLNLEDKKKIKKKLLNQNVHGLASIAQHI